MITEKPKIDTKKEFEQLCPEVYEKFDKMAAAVREMNIPYTYLAKKMEMSYATFNVKFRQERSYFFRPTEVGRLESILKEFYELLGNALN